MPHTSTSPGISESYAPTARMDLVEYMERLALDKQPLHRHTLGGADNSTSHMRAMLTDMIVSKTLCK